jgi:two-component sensor histidine kinase
MSGRVRLQITSDPVVLSPDEAIPIALLANEAITNAYKHAFPEGSAGEITLNLSCTAEQALVMQAKRDPELERGELTLAPPALVL